MDVPVLSPVLQTPVAPLLFEEALLRWGDKLWKVQVCNVGKPIMGGRCWKRAGSEEPGQITTSLQVPWRFESEQFSLSAGDRAEISLDSSTFRQIEITWSELRIFEEPVPLGNSGYYSTEYTLFQFQWRER